MGGVVSVGEGWGGVKMGPGGAGGRGTGTGGGIGATAPLFGSVPLRNSSRSV